MQRFKLTTNKTTSKQFKNKEVLLLKIVSGYERAPMYHVLLVPEHTLLILAPCMIGKLEPVESKSMMSSRVRIR